MKRSQHKNFALAMLLTVGMLLFTPYTCNTVSDKHANWSMFMHDLQNTGYSPSAAPDTPHLLWIFDTEQRLFGSPIVYNGTLYQVGRGSLFALDAETGGTIWSSELPVIGSTPFVTGESLYVGTCNGIAALNSKTGKPIWQVQLADFECDPWNDDLSNFIASSPIMTNTGVIMCTHRNISASYGYPNPEGINRVVCLDSETGTLLWQHPLDDRAGYSPAFIEGRVFINSTQLRVLDDETGQQLWSYTDAKGLYDTSPVIDHNAVVTISTDEGSVYQVDITAQELLWKCDLDSHVISTPAVHSNRVIVVTIEETIYALDENTGSVLWKREVHVESNFSAHDVLKNATASFNSSPAIADNKIYVGLRSGTFLCLELDTGEILWQYETKGSIIASPAVADEKVFMASTDGKVYCFGIDPETYFQKAEQYDKQGNTEKAREFYMRAKDYYESQGNSEMIKKCEKKLNSRRYLWVAVVLVGCMIICAMVVYWKMHKSNKSR
ncbi:MAG: PQQ-binding-like beta-propeller repeat protein [Theionarchaea archaeon]|nr:MAG: hypothetical protein AYK19_01185 [Theionarchaea archaeon DG-70-1]MBU7028771.1 PQQ-binding-like beta-propeller repeat protein [Theionarchaea archaeon]